MSFFPETELILTPESRVYHLNLKGEDIADDVILVGDPNRVEQVSRFFSKIEFRSSHREFIAHTGFYKGKRLTVLSTGIGTDNIDIVLNELDAAVNIDLNSRELLPKKRTLNIYRLGTCGSLQADVPVDSFVLSSHGIGLDGLLNFYAGLDKINEQEISEAFIAQLKWPDLLPFPYCIAASPKLLSLFKSTISLGITVTAPGFYGPQGREIRLKTSMPSLNEDLLAFRFDGHRIINFEMETSALYGLGKLLGHECVTICVVIANRVTKEFCADSKNSVEHLIEYCLNKITTVYDA